MELVNKMVEIQEKREVSNLESIYKKMLKGSTVSVSMGGKKLGEFQPIDLNANRREELPDIDSDFIYRVPRGSGKSQMHFDMLSKMLEEQINRQAVIINENSTIEFIGEEDMNGIRNGRPVFNDSI